MAPQRVVESSPPTLDQVLAVMKDCNCSERQAKKALKLYNNDVEQAKQHQHMKTKYQPGSKSQRETSVNSPVLGPNKSTTTPERDFEDPDSDIEKGEKRESAAIDRAWRAGSKEKAVKDPSTRQRSVTNEKSKTEGSVIEPITSKMEQRSGVPVGQDHSVWDYVLPKMDFPGTPLYKDGPKPFDLESLIYNIQLGADCRYVRNYLANYDKAHVRRELNGIIDGFPSIFYVVARNDDSILRLWVANGGNVGAIHEASQVPLLAFAIAHSENSQRDMTAIVATILGLGADPACIPEEFYTPYTDDLPIDGPETIEENEKTAWCKIEARKKLGKTLNFSQRYFLWRATCTDRPSVRAKQITLRKNAQAILEIPYFMIGQTVASNRIFTRLLNHISMPSSKTKPNMKPLVLVFAGPSGHGKTELARQLGHLLSLDLEVADCTIVEHERELFGPRHPYVGAERGTPLNNFLARHADQGCIAFLDEFEKTTKDVHEALLLPFDNGEYQDRRDLRRINCTKTIWILATNALDEQIISFCDRYEDIIVGDESTKQKLGRTLSKELKQAFLQRFGAPLTGRISDFVPFVPFSAGEQAVVAHKFLRELTSTIREPVDLCEGSGERLIGNINLHVKHDASVCTTIAKSDYSRDLGARSLSVAVKAVEGLVVELYYQEDEEIVEDGKMMDVMVDSHAGEIRVKLLDPSS